MHDEKISVETELKQLYQRAGASRFPAETETDNLSNKTESKNVQGLAAF